MIREVVNFAEEKETLLITLYAKAEESKLPDTLLKDHVAAEAIRHIEYPFDKLNLGSLGIVGLTFRAKLWTNGAFALSTNIQMPQCYISDAASTAGHSG